MEDLTQEWTQLRPFFPKSGHFFRFSNKGKGGLPPPPSSCAPEIPDINIKKRRKIYLEKS